MNLKIYTFIILCNSFSYCLPILIIFVYLLYYLNSLPQKDFYNFSHSFLLKFVIYKLVRLNPFPIYLSCINVISFAYLLFILFGLSISNKWIYY